MLTKEQIISVLKENIEIEQTGYMNGIADLVGLEDAAEQILLLVQPNSETPPQLNKHDVSGRSEQLPLSEDDVWASADNYVFVDNGMKWSNNDSTAGDNFGSFIAGAKWAIQMLSGNCH